MSKKIKNPLEPEKMLELEKVFRAGIMPWNEMGRQFGVSMRWLKNTADVLGWVRDLGEKIQQGAARKEQEDIARAEKRLKPDYKLSEKEVTESNIDVIARVSGSHRVTLARVRGIAEKLLDELEFAGNERELLETLASELYTEKATSKAELIARLSSIPGRTSAFKQLVDSLKIIIATEREVLRIGENTGNNGGDTTIGAFISRVMGTGFKPVQEHHGDD